MATRKRITCVDCGCSFDTQGTRTTRCADCKRRHIAANQKARYDAVYKNVRQKGTIYREYRIVYCPGGEYRIGATFPLKEIKLPDIPVGTRFTRTSDPGASYIFDGTRLRRSA